MTKWKTLIIQSNLSYEIVYSEDVPKGNVVLEATIEGKELSKYTFDIENYKGHSLVATINEEDTSRFHDLNEENIKVYLPFEKLERITLNIKGGTVLSNQPILVENFEVDAYRGKVEARIKADKVNMTGEVADFECEIHDDDTNEYANAVRILTKGGYIAATIAAEYVEIKNNWGNVITDILAKCDSKVRISSELGEVDTMFKGFKSKKIAIMDNTWVPQMYETNEDDPNLKHSVTGCLITRKRKVFVDQYQDEEEIDCEDDDEEELNED